MNNLGQFIEKYTEMKLNFLFSISKLLSCQIDFLIICFIVIILISLNNKLIYELRY